MPIRLPFPERELESELESVFLPITVPVPPLGGNGNRELQSGTVGLAFPWEREPKSGTGTVIRGAR